MTDNSMFERSVSEYLADDGSGTAQAERLAASIYEETGQVRQRPRWLALIKEPPMRSNSRLAVGSPPVRVAAIMVATLLLAMLVAGAGVAGQRLLAADDPIIVAQDGSGTHTTISAAVAAAQDGDVILVRPGPDAYVESVTIDTGITLSGDGDREEIVIEAPRDSSTGALSLVGSDARIENLTFRGQGSRIVISGGSPVLTKLLLDEVGGVYAFDGDTDPTPAGLLIRNDSTATLQHSTLRSVQVNIETGAAPSLLGNEFSPGQISVYEGAGNGVVIQDNTIDGNPGWAAIYVRGDSQPRITGNTIVGASAGVELHLEGELGTDQSIGTFIDGNKIRETTRAILVPKWLMATVSNNHLDNNETGISVGSATVVVNNNEIKGGATGIFYDGDGSPMLEGNNVTEASRSGMAIYDGSPVLVDNTICGNARNLDVRGSAAPQVDTTNEVCDDGLEP